MGRSADCEQRSAPLHSIQINLYLTIPLSSDFFVFKTTSRSQVEYQGLLSPAQVADQVASLLHCMIVCWLLNVPATCECISGMDLLRQFYVLPH